MTLASFSLMKAIPNQQPLREIYPNQPLMCTLATNSFLIHPYQVVGGWPSTSI
jgi:hypothetical protein